MGKTTTAVEFARWYSLTGGIERMGRVLLTSFERPNPLPRVLDTLGRAFAPELDAGGINWLALSDAQRRDVALQLLRQVDTLWVWDNVEPVAGFPSGTPSTLTTGEQRELAEFLRAARNTKAKFLRGLYTSLSHRGRVGVWADGLRDSQPGYGGQC